jgi:F-type H+-transporting ATPase subunit alpha
MKKVAGRLRLDLAQYRALEAFAQLGTELDKASQAQLDRGARVVQVLNQGQYEPVPVEKQVISIWAVTNGLLDDIPVSDVKRFETDFLLFMDASRPEIGQAIRNSGDLSEDTESQLKAAVEEFKGTFAPSGDAPPPKEAEAEELEGEEQEAVRRFRRPKPEDVERKAGPAGQGSQGAP